MKLEIKDKWAQMVRDDTLRQNARKSYEVEFAFDASWNGFAKTAIFEAGSASVIVALTEDRCVIPAQCLKQGSVKLKIGVYGVKGADRKATVWCETSMIIPDAGLDIGSSGTGTPGPTLPDDVYSEIMAAIGDLSAAGFEGKTLAEAFREIRDSVCETATDEEVCDLLNGTFGSPSGGSVTPEDTEPGGTATDAEVSDLLDEVFGEQP